MKGLFRFFAVVGFCLLTSGAMSQVTMSDIVRWGLLRKSELLPSGNATITYINGGTLRVIESYRVVDSNTFVLAVSSNLVATSNVVMTEGVYLSASSETTSNRVDAVWADGWAFTSVDTNGSSFHQWASNSTYEAVWIGTNAWARYPTALFGYLPTNNVPVGSATVDYYRFVFTVTNDFDTVWHRGNLGETNGVYFTLNGTNYWLNP